MSDVASQQNQDLTDDETRPAKVVTGQESRKAETTMRTVSTKILA